MQSIKRSPAVLVLLGLLLAGCMSAGNPKEGEPAKQEHVRPPDLDALEIILENCVGGVMHSVIPAEWGRPFIPDGFEERLLVVDAYEVSIRMRDCERAIINETVEENVQWLTASIILFQEMDAASGRQTTIQVASVTSSEVIADLLDRLGAATEVADFESSGDALVEPVAVLGWTAESDNVRLEFEFANIGLPQSTGVRKSASWIAGPPHVRIDGVSDETDATIYDQDFIVMRLGGNSILNELFGNNPAWNFDQQARWNSHYQYTFTGGFEP